MEAYFEAFEASGLVVEALREPGVPPEASRRDPAEGRWNRIPNFLWLRARHGSADRER
jgi:hypothetical protein